MLRPMAFQQLEARHLGKVLLYLSEVQGADEVALIVGQAIGTEVGQQTGTTACHGFHIGLAADGVGHALRPLDIARHRPHGQPFGAETYAARHQVVILPHGGQQ